MWLRLPSNSWAPAPLPAAPSNSGREGRTGGQHRSYTPPCWKRPQGSPCSQAVQGAGTPCGVRSWGCSAGSGRSPAPAPGRNHSFESNEDGKPTDALCLTESDGGSGRREKSEINPVTAAEETSFYAGVTMSIIWCILLKLRETATKL